MSLLDRLYCFLHPDGHQFNPSRDFDHLEIVMDECDRCGKKLVAPAKDKEGQR